MSVSLVDCVSADQQNTLKVVRASKPRTRKSSKVNPPLGKRSQGVSVCRRLMYSHCFTSVATLSQQCVSLGTSLFEKSDVFTPGKSFGWFSLVQTTGWCVFFLRFLSSVSNKLGRRQTLYNTASNQNGTPVICTICVHRDVFHAVSC